MSVKAVTFGIAIALSLAAVAGRAETVACDGGGLAVTAPETALAERVCSVAVAARERMEVCDLRQSQPISIIIQKGVVVDAFECLGAFHCDTNEIELIHPQALAENVPASRTYAGLSPMAVFDSLVVHEMAHALLEQTLGEREVGVAAHEYVAYAMQLSSLSPEDRAIFTAQYSAQASGTSDGLNAIVMMFAPGAFATSAWMHFTEPGNGCAFVEDLIEGRAILDLPPL